MSPPSSSTSGALVGAVLAILASPRDRYKGPCEIVFEWTDGRPKRNRFASGTTVGEPA